MGMYKLVVPGSGFNGYNLWTQLTIVLIRESVFNFLPSQQKVNEKLLCDLCDSSEAGGESMYKQ